jgi:hypothetical protein
MSKFTFLVTNPDGTTISIHPISYRSEWPLNGHQTLTFRCFNGETINERATINVYKTVSDMPVFCGWFTRFKRPSFKSGLPQQYNCAGFSKLLLYRYAFKTSYNWYETESSTITSLLKQANSMAIGWIASTYAGSPANTFCLEKTGTNPLYLPRLPLADPTIYLGSTLLTKGTGLSTLAANQWYRDTERIYIRTSGSNPNNYPCYITGFKDSHLVAGTLAANNLITPGITVPDEAIWTTFLRIVENQGLEYRFTNRTDGGQNVDASSDLYGGWYDAPVKTYVRRPIRLRDWHTRGLKVWNRLDHSKELHRHNRHYLIRPLCLGPSGSFGPARLSPWGHIQGVYTLQDLYGRHPTSPASLNLPKALF